MHSISNCSKPEWKVWATFSVVIRFSSICISKEQYLHRSFSLTVNTKSSKITFAFLKHYDFTISSVILTLIKGQQMSSVGKQFTFTMDLISCGFFVSCTHMFKSYFPLALRCLMNPHCSKGVRTSEYSPM